MPYITIQDGLRAYYDFAGFGPALFMVHGASQDTLSWQHNIEFFAQHYSVYALDLPGHGKSALPAGGPNCNSADNAQYLLDVMAALHIDSAVLMGHSMGGGIVTQAAVMAPERVRGLVLVDGASVNVVKSSGYNPNILQMAKINPGDWFEVTFRTLMGSTTPPERINEIITDARRCIPFVAYSDIVAFGGFRMEKILGDVHCPVLILEGSEDWSVPPESARAVQRILKDRGVPVDYIELDGLGHFPHAECPDVFNTQTLAAMKRLSL